MLEGVDTSFWQGNFTPAPPATFNIINASRANNGGLGVGSWYHVQVNNARAVGAEVGHYFFNGNIDVIACADFFVDNLYDFRKGFDVVVLDVESESSTGTIAWNPAQVMAWAQRVASRLGIPMSTIGVYLNRSLMQAYDWSGVVRAGIWLWIAYPGSDPGQIYWWPDWTMWQYTSAGGLDRNQSKLSLAQIAGGTAQKETKVVDSYHYEDRQGRTLAPGEKKFLNDGTQDKNVVGAVGAAYSITPHLYAEGLQEGDSIELALVWENTKYPEPWENASPHYTVIGVANRDGQIRITTEFKRGVVSGDMVFVRVIASASNKGTATITVLDCDAYNFATV